MSLYLKVCVAYALSGLKLILQPYESIVKSPVISCKGEFIFVSEHFISGTVNWRKNIFSLSSYSCVTA